MSEHHYTYSIVRQYQGFLKLDGVDLVFEGEAIKAVAQKAMEQKTGARGIRSIVENTMMDIMYDIPSLKGTKKIVVTREVIDDSVKPEIIFDKKTA